MRLQSILALFLAALAYPTAAAPNLSGDLEGNIYPIECRRDLSGDASLMSRVVITWNDNMPRHLGGITYPRLVGGKVLIVMNSFYTGHRRDDYTQHELCHAAGLLGLAPTQWPRHRQ